MDELDRIGRFETVRLLGRGGMGEVYLARDPLIDRLVAVKLLSAAFDAVARDRFTREARAAGRLAHENIVTIFDVGEHNGRPFIAMEYVPGETLGVLIRQRPSPPRGELLRLIHDACIGLAFAHRSGVVHLDVKPDNLIRREDGRLKVLDFGLARVVAIDETHTRHSAGTLRYMSPEQLNGGLVDHRSDVFGVGCVLFEAVTGQPAFGSTWPDVLARLNAAWVPRLSDFVRNVHPALERMTSRALARDPAERYQELGMLAAELAALRREIGAGAPDDAETGSFSGSAVTPPVAAETEWLVPNTAPEIVADAGRPPTPPAELKTSDAAIVTATPQAIRWVLAGLVALAAIAVAVSLWPRPASIAERPTDAPPAAPATAPAPAPPPADASATPAPIPTIERRDAGAVSAAVWQAIARRDHEAALQLLRSQTTVDERLLGEVLGAARVAAAEARRAADARGRTTRDSVPYRLGLEALARARRLDAAGPSIDGLAATWEASDAFARAMPAAGPDRSATPAAAPASAAATPPAPPGAGRQPETTPAPAARDIPLTAPPPNVSPPAPLPPPPPAPAVAAPPAAAPTERPAPTPAPAAEAPVRRTPSAEESVRAALAAYEAAYDAHDVAALRQVFRGLSADQAQALTRTFAEAVSYRLDLRVLDVSVASATAEATCVVTHALVPKVGSTSRTTQTATFHLVPAGDGWVITRIATVR